MARAHSEIYRYRDSGDLDEFQLIEEWRYDPKVPEFTWLRVLAEGSDGAIMEWTVQDYGGDDGHSMARTTGLVTAICTEAWIDDSKCFLQGCMLPKFCPMKYYQESSGR